MFSFETLLWLGGIAHFGILIASALVPQVLDWKGELQKLPRLFAQLVWVHGAFVVLMIVGFGVLTLTTADELAAGSRLARAVCAFVAVFWGTRLATQFFYFEPGPYLKRLPLRVGYHALTVVFVFLTVVYGWGAIGPTP